MARRSPITLKARILEYLEADGGWLSGENILHEVHQRSPHVKRDSIQRTIHRLREAGLIEVRERAEYWTHPRWGALHSYRYVDGALDRINPYESRGGSRRRTA